MIALAPALKSARLQAIATYLDSGSGAGKLRVYDGTQPLSGAALSGNNLLAELVFPKPSFDRLALGVMYLKNPNSVMATLSGTATWVRLLNGDGDFVADLNAGMLGSGAVCIFDNTTIFAGGSVSALSLGITE
jgi:hypothetical protein